MAHTLDPGLAVGTGLFDSLANLVAAGATLILVLMLIALGGFAYRSLVGDGVTWPDDVDEETDGEGVTRSHGDDEWKYH